MGASYLKSGFESLLVFGVMTGVLLPARLLFVEYVSDNWYGSLGIISAISVLIIILTKKKKLGFFGPMIERQILKFQTGKKGLIVFGESIFLLLILGSMIFAIDYGYSYHVDFHKQSVTDTALTPESILEPTKNWNTFDWMISVLKTPLVFITAFPEMSATIALIDQKLDGWLMHFYTVGFVEYLELLGILVFYRVSFKKKTASSISTHIHSKAAI